jgi:hypothetical protein
VICDPCAIANYIKTLIPVITEVIMVADVKYANNNSAMLGQLDINCHNNACTQLGRIS